MAAADGARARDADHGGAGGKARIPETWEEGARANWVVERERSGVIAPVPSAEDQRAESG